MRPANDRQSQTERNWTNYAEQARAARSEYIGGLLNTALTTAVRALTSAASHARQKWAQNAVDVPGKAFPHGQR